MDMEEEKKATVPTAAREPQPLERIARRAKTFVIVAACVAFVAAFAYGVASATAGTVYDDVIRYAGSDLFISEYYDALASYNSAQGVVSGCQWVLGIAAAFMSGALAMLAASRLLIAYKTSDFS